MISVFYWLHIDCTRWLSFLWGCMVLILHFKFPYLLLKANVSCFSLDVTLVPVQVLIILPFVWWVILGVRYWIFAHSLQKAEAQLAYELQAAKTRQKIRNEEISIEVVERRKQIEVGFKYQCVIPLIFAVKELLQLCSLAW